MPAGTKLLMNWLLNLLLLNYLVLNLNIFQINHFQNINQDLTNGSYVTLVFNK